MNKKHNWLTNAACMGLMMTALIGCNSDEPITVGGGTGIENDDSLAWLEKDKLGLFAYNGSTDISLNVWGENSTIGLFLTKDSLGHVYENDKSTYSNIKAAYSNGGWIVKPDVKLSERPAVIYAYAPYRDDVDPFNMTVECASGEHYMYGTHLEPQTSVRMGENVARLFMKQTQALVDFRIKKKDWDGEVKLQKVVLRKKAKQEAGFLAVQDSLAFVPDSTNALPIEGSLNIQSGELVHTAYGTIESKDMNVVVTEAFNTSARAVLTVLPYDIKKDDVELVFKVNGRQWAVALQDNKDWKAGTRNIINLTFTGEGFEIEQSIKAWNDVEQEIWVY